MSRTKSTTGLEPNVAEAYARREDLLQSLLVINRGDPNGTDLSPTA